MGSFVKKELPDYSDDDLLSLVRNSKKIDKNRLTEIIDELKKRGYSEQINKIENDLIKLNPIYAKFWNRIGAFLIDILILGVIGFILGLFFKNSFVQMGSQGIWVGFIITLIYFGFSNSKIFNGQTIGKNVLKLQTVNKNLDLLTIQKSLLRALIYTVPYFFLNYRLVGLSEFSVFYIVKSSIFLSFLIVLPIHLMLNSATRQTLYDLLLGTYVVSLEAYPRQELKKSKSLPVYISGLVLIVLIVFNLFFNLRNNNLTKINNLNKIANELSPIKEQIDKISEVGNSSISKSWSSTKKIGSDDYNTKTDYVSLNIFLKDDLISSIKPKNVEDLDFVQDAIRIILKGYTNVKQLDFIQVNLIYGYNIGIYKSYQSLGTSNTIDNWKQKLQ